MSERLVTLLKPKVVIVGSSGHAKVVLDIIEKEGRYAVQGFIDAFKQAGQVQCGYPVLGSESDLPQLIAAHGLYGYIVAIGDNYVRMQVCQKVAKHASDRLVLVNAIHPQAVIAKRVAMGSGNVVMAGAIVNTDCILSNNTITNTRASLDHDSVLEDGASLAPNATLGGNCHIGRGAAIGISATLIHRIRVGENAVVGAGATVLKDVAPNTVVYGSPARWVRNRQAGDTYL